MVGRPPERSSGRATQVLKDEKGVPGRGRDVRKGLVLSSANGPVVERLMRGEQGW